MSEPVHPGIERLWSPWRMPYLEAASGDPGEVGGCIFCEQPAAGDDEGTYILARGDRAFVMLNAFPYNPGHLLVAPFRHVGELDELEEAEASQAQALLRRAVTALREVAAPDGFNVGMNLGRVAGAGIPGHLHWHLVPRWNGDTNFMTVVGKARVLPEALAATYEKLAPRI